MTFITNFSTTYPLVWLSLVAILGGIVGSFLNVVIYRLPIILNLHLLCEVPNQESRYLIDIKRFNLFLPRSHCPYCRCPIIAIDNIPLLSFLWLKGRARCCGEHIGWVYPLVEIINIVGFLVAAQVFPLGISLFGCWIFISFLLVSSVIDYQTHILPDVLILPLLWLGILFNLQGGFVDLQQAVLGAISGYLCLWSLFWIFKLFTGKDALGYGDFKLLAALGAWLGWQSLPLILLLASSMGGALTLVGRIWMRKDLNQPLAFGPWLAASGVACMLIS
ncbi:prepilin peptidase [Yersinia enterocolitica]|uniref:prepilin peptidase n=1 Tax=Yersinia enterocolitica TaxID=630 RepID=UPI003AB82F21